MQWILTILLGIVIIFVGIVGGMCEIVSSVFR